MAEEVLFCPFCGAPYSESIPAGVVQVKCRYCGAEILVPPRLGGAVRRCPNHPELLALGLCNDCGKSFCDQCLYVWEIDHGRLNLCSKCYQNRNVVGNVVSVIGFAFSVILLLVFFVVLFAPGRSGDGSFVVLLFWGLILMAVSLASRRLRKKPESVRDLRAQSTVSVFMKKCIDCGKEIPIASEQCQYCGANQPEYAG